jgi:hypothetical protein
MITDIIINPVAPLELISSIYLPDILLSNYHRIITALCIFGMPTNSTESANLVEHGMKYFISNTLRQCNKKRREYITWRDNVGYIIAAVVLIGGALWYKRSNRETDVARTARLRARDDYIYTKMCVYNSQHRPVPLADSNSFDGMNAPTTPTGVLDYRLGMNGII